MNWRAPAVWQDGRCWIIGGGPSMPRQFGVPEEIIQKAMVKEYEPSVFSEYLKPIHDQHVIGVNNAYQIGNWIDALFFGDCSWYLVHRLRLANWPGLKVTCCNRFASRNKEESEGIKYLARDREHQRGISFNTARVSWNGNSGCAAISLAAHFGVKQILLLGFDMDVDKQNVTHWHGSHGPDKLARKPPFKRHLKGLPLIAADAKTRGIEILNVSKHSQIKEFKKVKLSEVL